MSGSRVALLVATDAYVDPKLIELGAPQHDATALASVLGDPEIGGFRVETLVNRPLQEIRVRANELFSEAGRDDLVLFYISGHGLKDEAGRLHFACTDTRLSLLASTALHSQWIKDLIDNSRAGQTVVWLDCCYGGAFPASMIFKAEETVDVVPQLTVGGRGIAVMTASTGMQFAFEGGSRVSGQPQPSVFTEAIVAGLRDGDADLDDDGEIDAAELYDYVYDWVKQATPNQTPTRNDQLTGQLVIAHSKRGLRLSPDLPVVVRQTLRDPRPEIRLAAVDMLYRLTNAANPAERAAAESTLDQLSAGIDSVIAEAAIDALHRLTGEPVYVEVDPPFPDDPPEPPARPIVRTPFTVEPPARQRGDDVVQVVFWGAAAVLTAGLGWFAWGSKDFGTWFSWILFGGTAVVIWLLGISVIQLRSRSVVLPVQTGTPAAVAFSPDGTLLVCGGPGSTAWETEDWTDVLVAPMSGRFAFSPDGDFLATARMSHVRVFGPDLNKQTQTMELSSWALAFNPDGSTLAVACDNDIMFWRTSDWVRLDPLVAHYGEIVALAFSADGTMMASASSEGDIKLWDTAEWTRVRTLAAHSSRVIMLAFSANGDFLASVDANRLRIWRAGQSQESHVISNWAGGGGAIAFSPTADLLAYGSAASSIKLLDPETGLVVRTMFGHRKPVTGLAFSPDGTVLASASKDGTVRLWRIGPSLST
jgi:hypothetical protein